MHKKHKRSFRNKPQSFTAEVITKILRLLIGLAFSLIIFRFISPIFPDSEFTKIATTGASMAGFFKPFSEIRWQQALLVFVILLGIIGLFKMLGIPKKYGTT